MKRAVLVGAGHAHLYTLKRAAEFVRRGFEIVLVTPDRFWYSGLATGMLGGFYEPALDQIEAGKLIERGGGRCMRDTVTAIKPRDRSVELAGGQTLSYDVLSLNVGSVGNPLPGTNERVVEIKPIANLAKLRSVLERRTEPVRIVVAGAGPSGCEMAANVRALLLRRGLRGEVFLLCADGEPLSGKSKRVRAKMSAFLRAQNVLMKTHARVESVAGDRLHLADGRELAFDLAINATGLKPPPLLRQSGLPVDADGALLVNDFLHSTGDGKVFGGGDGVAMEDRRIDKVGVYAIRQAPILYRNLLASLSGEGLRRFTPQKRYLLILNLGDGSGLAIWGGWHWESRLAFRWKDWLDRKFLDEYRNA